MNSIYIGNDIYSYHQLNSDIKLKLFSLNNCEFGLYILEVSPTYDFIVEYLSLQKSNNSILLVEDISNIHTEILNELKIAFTNIYLPNRVLTNNISTVDKSLINIELILTSGTTSKQKIVAISSNTIFKNSLRINDKFNVDSSVCELVNMPLHHSFGITRLRCGINRGANIYLAKGLLDPKMLKKCITNENKIFIGSVSTGLELFISFFNKYLIQQTQKTFFIETGSMEIKPKLIDLIKKTFNNFTHYHHYGSSEVSRSFFAGTDDLNYDSLNLGEISDGLKYKVVKDELLIKGSNLFSGYLSQGKLSYIVDETNYLTDDLFFNTGDFVKEINEMILFSSRKKEIINLNGLKYSPIVLENKLSNSIKGIFDVVVIQYPGDCFYFIVCELNENFILDQTVITLINDISRSLFVIKPKKIISTKIIKTNSRKKIRKHELYSDQL